MRRVSRAAAAAGLALLLAPAHGADVGRGGALYSQHCAACHGANGIAVMPGAPHFARRERLMQPDVALLGSIKFGKNSMPAFVSKLKDQEILDIVAYIRTIR